MQVITAEGQRKAEISEWIEFILPWLNLELWDKIQSNKKEGRENVAYEAQMQAAFQGQPLQDVWNPDPNTPIPELDDLIASAREQDPATKRKGSVDELFKQAPMPESIKNTIFRG